MKLKMLRGLAVASLAMVIALVSKGADAAAAKKKNYDRYSFAEYVKDYAKSYDSVEEYEKRKAIFEANLEIIQSHNSNRNSKQHSLGVNPYADLTADELPRGYNKAQSSKYNAARRAAASRQRYLKNNDDQTKEAAQLELLEQHLQIKPVSSLPTTVDWRGKGVTTPVKSQGRCGSCWAFASTAVLESHIALQTGTLFEFSEQELVSCAPNPQHCGGTGGCAGSTAELAFEHAMLHGMVQEWDFGYQSYHGEAIECSLVTKQQVLSSTKSPKNRLLRRHGLDNDLLKARNQTMYKGAVASIAGYVTLPSNNYTVLMNAVAQLGPVAVSVACIPWHLYQGGIFYTPLNTTIATDIDHLVVLEGYGTDEATGQKYWSVRNSWGPLWGEAGYIRLLRRDPAQIQMDDPDDSYCGIDTKPADGVACTKDKSGHDIVPPAAKICGNSGVLYDTSIPLGGHLL